jgi:hypothetical protein
VRGQLLVNWARRTGANRDQRNLLGVTPTCHRLECLDHAGPILTEPTRINGGHALTPERAATAWNGTRNWSRN